MCKNISRYILLLTLPLFSQESANIPLAGTWKLVPEKSSEIGLFKTLQVSIQADKNDITVIQTWGSGRSFVDTLRLPRNGQSVIRSVQSRVWPDNVFMAISRMAGTERKLCGRLNSSGRQLEVKEESPVWVSQGTASLSVQTSYALNDDGTLTMTVTRPSRPAVDRYVLVRDTVRPAFVMHLTDDWAIDGKLPEQAMLISLQGLANDGAPRLYFIYGPKWDFRFTPSMLDFYKEKKGFRFSELASSEDALKTFLPFVKGYIVWDTKVRTSLIVAFTLAGLEKAIVITEEMIPLAQKYNLRLIDDFRGRFSGQKDIDIYTWAYQKYWSRCSRDYIVWMGGESGSIMRPGVADFGILKGAFFNDLSTEEIDGEEYALAKKLMSEMKPMSMVMGWHSYAKDKERDHVKLASSFALRVEGLHTLPNLSFSHQTPITPGFKFKNQHNVVKGQSYLPENKVYVSCIQTDCLGLGAWVRPGRGSMPYAWEVTMNWVWLAPSMLEYFYSQATPNDYFIGSLGGPGYMYPKAIPPRYLPQVVSKAYELMKQLDLNVFEIMDYSQGATVEGNSDLTPTVVDAFYKGMPDIHGLVNGYAPSFSFTVRDGKPLISFDYYLSETRPAEAAVADLKELASLNQKRPYFLLVHVREWSDIDHVKRILDQLGPEFKTVPLDIFLKMAGSKPTFQEKLLK
jgi:hypothetical protein